MDLYITEKPSVGMEFAKALGIRGQREDGYIQGDDVIITWCIGHLITMSYPEKYDPELKKWTIETLPFLPQPDKYLYEVIPDVKKQFSVVRGLLNAKNIDTIYWSGDSAREGEYIARLVRQEAGYNKNAKEKRVWIDSQTREEILRGIKDAKDLSAYDKLSDAAYARAIEDYALGINLSRIVTLKYRRILKAVSGIDATIAVGRVMTCVLGMIVQRERQIRDGVKTPYYTIYAKLGELMPQWKALETSQFYTEGDLYKTNKVTGFLDVKKAAGFVTEMGDKITFEKMNVTKQSKAAPLLFNLAELQGECTKAFKIPPDKTLSIAQKLYEAKLTTYPRTDARVITTAVYKEITKHIKGLTAVDEVSKYAEDILNDKKYESIRNSKYINDKAVSDHYAIIPTGQTDALSSLSEIERKVYILIVRRFLSIFMPATVYKKVKGIFTRKGENFEINASDILSLGWLEVADKIPDTNEAKTNINLLAQLKPSATYNCEYLSKKELTSLPSRYTSGSIILAMENAGTLIEDEELREQIKGSGIGTSATRAEVIKKLIKNKYIKVNAKTQVLQPDLLGEMIYEVILLSAPKLLQPEMTANWEKGLSQVADGTITQSKYISLLYTFVSKLTNDIKNNDYTVELRKQLEKLSAVYKDIKADAQVGSSSGTYKESAYKCPKCGRPLSRIPSGVSVKPYA